MKTEFASVVLTAIPTGFISEIIVHPQIDALPRAITLNFAGGKVSLDQAERITAFYLMEHLLDYSQPEN